MTFRYRKLTPDNDYSFGHGASDFYIDQPEAVAQAIKTRLDLWRNEWFLNLNEGTNWQSVVGTTGATETMQPGILGYDGYVNIRDAIVRERVSQTPYVHALYDWRGSLDNRVYSVSGKVLTAFGMMPLDVRLAHGTAQQLTWAG